LRFVSICSKYWKSACSIIRSCRPYGKKHRRRELIYLSDGVFLITGTGVSRVMSRMIIYLGLMLPSASSDLPESRPGKPVAFCLVLLRMGFTWSPPVTRRAVVSYTAFPPLPCQTGRFISVALALELPPPDVIRHPALRSPDFPHLLPKSADSRDHSPYLWFT